MRRELVFHGLQTTWWFLLCAGAVAGALLLIFVLFSYERRLVTRKVGTTLLALRAAVLGVLLITLMQPVIAWTVDRSRTAQILVAVDLSESMGTADKHATRGEKLRWARALGMIGNAATDERLDRWQKAFDEGNEPEWVNPGETSRPERAAQLAASRREMLEGIFAELDRVPRQEMAARLLTGTSRPLIAELQKLGNVQLVAFAGKAQSSEAARLDALTARPPDSILIGASDLAQPLGLGALTGDPADLLGIVLLSDGRDNAAHDPLGAAKRLGQLSIPVYPVLLGSELRPKDLAIASLDYPQQVFKDDRTLLKATLSTPGFEGEELTIVLERRGDEEEGEEEILESFTKMVTPDGPSAAVEFELDAKQLGRHEYVVRTEVRPGETRDDNNSRTLAVTVIDDRSHVLLLEGEPRWEFRFLDNALTRDPRVEARQVVFEQPYIGLLPDTFFPRGLDWPHDDDLAISPLGEMHLVVLGDVSPAHLPDRAWRQLEKFVAEAGGTVVFTAGRRHFPLRHSSPELARLLPMTNLAPVEIRDAAAIGPPAERGFHLELTPDGEGEPMLQFAADAEENRAVWATLPGQTWGILGEAKPGATVWATARLPGDAGLEAERRNAVIVHQHYGLGHVIWVGIDGTWRWRHRVGDAYHHRFWAQLARWAANKKTVSGNEFVRFGPDRTDIEIGEDAVLRARWTQQFLKENPNLKARVEISRADAKPGAPPLSVIDLAPIQSQSLVHEGRAVSLPSGAYRVKLLVENADVGDEVISAMLYVHDQPTLELSDLSANRTLLAQIADASGGRLFLPDQLDELPPLFRGFDEVSTTREEIDLWDHWLILTVLFALMTGEWAVRKLNGLP